MIEESDHSIRTGLSWAALGTIYRRKPRAPSRKLSSMSRVHERKPPIGGPSGLTSFAGRIKNARCASGKTQ